MFDVGQVDGVPYITMAFVEANPLSDLYPVGQGPAAHRSPRPFARWQRLAEAHAKGIVHRDLKPANVMINHRKEPIITDFGLANWILGRTRLTQMGMMLGTPSYMAAEQVAGNLDAIGPATDIYSLGVILYEMLTGRLPFEGPVTAVLGQIGLHRGEVADATSERSRSAARSDLHEGDGEDDRGSLRVDEGHGGGDRGLHAVRANRWRDREGRTSVVGQ